MKENTSIYKILLKEKTKIQNKGARGRVPSIDELEALLPHFFK